MIHHGMTYTIVILSNLAWQAKKNCLYSALNNKICDKYICDDDDDGDEDDDDDDDDDDVDYDDDDD